MNCTKETNNTHVTFSENGLLSMTSFLHSTKTHMDILLVKSVQSSAVYLSNEHPEVHEQHKRFNYESLQI